MNCFPKSMIRVSIGLVLIVSVLGCPKKPTESASQSVTPSQSQAQPATPPPVESAPPVEQHPVTEEAVKPGEPGKPVTKASSLNDVFFDFDKAAIKSEMKSVLDQDVAWLNANPKVKVQLEGHCDERGTGEYNLALGEKRAHSVKQYLISLGVKSVQLSTISYGKERPFCKEQTESCYQQNRRVHFVMK
ncbi:MAG: peptidoglycan-associated lipoprotein Pal [Nitrospiria bacterium]